MEYARDPSFPSGKSSINLLIGAEREDLAARYVSEPSASTERLPSMILDAGVIRREIFTKARTIKWAKRVDARLFLPLFYFLLFHMLSPARLSYRSKRITTTSTIKPSFYTR